MEDLAIERKNKILCLFCNGTTFIEKLVLFPVEIKDETVEVLSYAHVCLNCGEPLMDFRQMDMLRNKTADAYRKRHALLTSKEIREIRNNKTISGLRKQLAAVLGVTEKHIRSWETFSVQPKEIDEKLREI